MYAKTYKEWALKDFINLWLFTENSPFNESETFMQTCILHVSPQTFLLSRGSVRIKGNYDFN